MGSATASSSIPGNARVVTARAGAWLGLAALALATGGCAMDRTRPAVVAPGGVELTLDPMEMTELLKPISGEGGYQSLLRALQGRLDRTSGALRLERDELDRIRRYAFEYGQGGWEDRLRRIFGRQLGPQLDGRRE
jgi:hypothetical protein